MSPRMRRLRFDLNNHKCLANSAQPRYVNTLVALREAFVRHEVDACRVARFAIVDHVDPVGARLARSLDDAEKPFDKG